MELGANENSIRYTLSTFGNYITEHSWGQRLLSVKKKRKSNPRYFCFSRIKFGRSTLIRHLSLIY